jgi:Tfp pilus assembly protein PilF
MVEFSLLRRHELPRDLKNPGRDAAFARWRAIHLCASESDLHQSHRLEGVACAMTVETDELSSARRRLILRDSVTFLGLISVTAVLFAITLFLFRSFTAHRVELAQQWSERGRTALNAGQPGQAIVALRTALSYAPDERSYELLLAQALGDAGHLDESYNYFLGLWETEPGNGFINLSLARLAVRKRDTPAAVNYYHAAIYGTWEGDGTVRRREVRLELARYLISMGDPGSARSELLIAGGNNPNDAGVQLALADLLQQAGYPKDALNYYRKVLALEPKNETALVAAGRMEYKDGEFEEAHHLLERAARVQESDGSHEGSAPAGIAAMLENSARIVSLSPLEKLAPNERVGRILRARGLAKKRFDTCNAQLSAASGLASPLQGLSSRWMAEDAGLSRAALLKDAVEQDATVKLIFDTEVQTSQICGAPTGDDALLLLLAKSSKTMEP